MQFELIIKKLKNQLSSEEKIIFTEWYDSDVRHRDYFNKIKSNYYKNFQPVESNKAWKLIVEKLSFKKRKPYLKMAIAASFIGLLGLFTFFNLRTNFVETTIESSVSTGVIERPNGKAILTLENGTDIILTEQGYENKNIKSNGSELVYGVPDNESAPEEIVYNYLFVPRGGEFFVQLSDGTKVWLNAESKLKFPVKFSGASRTVELIYGEAYFEVSPSTLHQGKSFIVHTHSQVIEVLGTEFNLTAYKDEKNIVTTLVEGKVSLAHSEKSGVNMLVSGQQAIYNEQKRYLDIQQVDPDDIVAWRKGILRFKETSLKDIMLSLSRWYDLEVHFEDSYVEQRKFNGIFRKTQDIENILESIQKTQEAFFQIDGKKIIVKNPKK